MDNLGASDAKGAVVGHIAGGFPIHVRVGAANAGHTVYVDGQKHVVQQLPCAAYANPYAKLVLGAGAMISPYVLAHEIETNRLWREEMGCPPMVLHIDKRAHVVTDAHIDAEAHSDLAERIGSTSATAHEGIGAAQAARVLRTDFWTVEQEFELGSQLFGLNFEVSDTVELLHSARLFETPILLEGTQGTGLDNVLGLQYPYVTSRHVAAAGLAADVGLGPRDIDHVLVVARTYPIRVAGNSGPFWPDSTEISWESIGVDEQTETTTVTKKVRRVGTWSLDQIVYAAKVNSATEIAINFVDYLVPQLKDKTGMMMAAELDSYDFIGPLIRRVERATQVPVVMLGTGPQTTIDREPDGQF